MWTPEDPDNFDRFDASDMPTFLEYWEREHSDTIALQLFGVFVDGIAEPWLELIANSESIPEWVKDILRWRLAAQWVWTQGIPLMSRLERGLPGLLGVDYPDEFKITPAQLAEIPHQIRQAFLEGNRFSLQWVKRLSNDARSLTSDIMAANTLKNRNPMNAVPLLERVLRRDLVGAELGIDPEDVTPEMIDRWVQDASFKTLEAIANRAKLISVTEGARMQNLGILSSMEEQGETLTYVMPHAGSCEECQRLIDGRAFAIKDLKRSLFENFGKPKAAWVPALPQHPQCRHSPGPVPWKFKKALRAVSGSIPKEGILLEWYGLPGGKVAFEALGLPRLPWFNPEGQTV